MGYRERVCRVAGIGVGMALDTFGELNSVLDALDKAVTLMARLDTLPAEHQLYVKQVKTRMRWVTKHLALKAYHLAIQIESQVDVLDK